MKKQYIFLFLAVFGKVPFYLPRLEYTPKHQCNTTEEKAEQDWQMIFLSTRKFVFYENFSFQSTFVFVFELLFAHCVFVHRVLGKYPSFRLPVKQRGTTPGKQQNQQPPLFKQTETNEFLILSFFCKSMMTAQNIP